MTPASRPITPTCPRCGYDQSGEVAAWTDRCPLRGRCPECGDFFAWPDLFDPGRRDIPWYVEHARGVIGLARRTPPTLWRVARPGGFWREVGVESQVRLGRVVWMLLGLALSSHLVTAALLFALEYPRVSASHARWHTSRFFQNVYANDQFVDLAFESIFEPFLAVYASGWANASGALRVGGVSVMGWRIPWPIAMMAGVSLLWIVVLTVLPVTRRVCKLRNAHVARAALLSLLAPLFSLELTRVLMCVNAYWSGRSMIAQLWHAVPVINLALMAWMLRWWWCAVGTGWRLRPTPLIQYLGTAAALLGACVLALLLDMQGVIATRLF